ncbi:hypothetical protein EG329_012641 [Mollisiaceae sp. DMI_Dod_QoI]|nr:hypothetical protein EG329_012641 [Helotiales sp. DMI_Dod_QoI]
MSICLPVDCSVPWNYTTQFDADPDIDGIGVIASFYFAAWTTVILLTVEYLIAPPHEFANFGRSQLDIRFVKKIQHVSKMKAEAKAKAKTRKALQKAILLLSDQQLITGISITIVGLARLCQITQYHFTTVQNLALAASVAHSMTFGSVEQYIEQKSFFRIWRAIGMLLFGVLLLVLWIVTGNNNWINVYGMPALCGYQNLSQGFGPPATTSLAILYWFLLRGWVFSLTVLFPHYNKLPWILKALSTNFWLGKICDFLEKCFTQPASRRVAQEFWIFFRWTSFILLVVVYAAFEVWGSYAFNLTWAYYTFSASVMIVSGLRNTASNNGMIGTESQWSFGQQLPLLLLILPTFAMIEMFFGKSPPLEEARDLVLNNNTSLLQQSSDIHGLSLLYSTSHKS